MTLVLEWDIPFAAGVLGDFSHTLTPAEEAILANYEDLQVWFVTDGDQPEVTWFAFDVPLSIGSASVTPSESESASDSESASKSGSASASTGPRGQPYRKRLGGLAFNGFRSRGQW